MKNTIEYVRQICIKREKEIDSAIFMEIKDIAIENGIKTEYVLNEKAIINALEKQIPKEPKIKIDYDGRLWGEDFVGKYVYCPCCNTHLMSVLNDSCVAGGKEKYCSKCGQAIDWSDAK